MALLALVMPFVLGVAAVNAYYGYYRDWHGLVVGLQGTPEPGLAALPQRPIRAAAAVKLTNDPLASTPGKLVELQLAGAPSGISRAGYVYVPPEYGDARFPTSELPIVELLHGTPGQPDSWITSLHIGKVMDQLRATHQVSPMILVMPNSNGARKPVEEVKHRQPRRVGHLQGEHDNCPNHPGIVGCDVKHPRVDSDRGRRAARTVKRPSTRRRFVRSYRGAPESRARHRQHQPGRGDQHRCQRKPAGAVCIARRRTPRRS